MAGWSNSIFENLPAWLGGSSSSTPLRPTTADVPRPTGYPTADDVAAARNADASYGDPSAAFVQPPYGGQVASPRTNEGISTAFSNLDDTGETGVRPAPIRSPVADNLMAGYLASRRSALAALGFDPRNMTIGDPPSGENPWGVSGEYDPVSDQIVTTGVFPSTTAHESMHRGMQALRQAGVMPPEVSDSGLSEESIIRAQMLRNYGPIEQGRGKTGDEQVRAGQWYNENKTSLMDKLEAVAAQIYAKKHPGGPR